MKKALVLYPNQLFDVSFLPEVDLVILVEDPLFFGTDQEFPLTIHKQKLILMRAAMRRYMEEVLWPAKFAVDYLDHDPIFNSGQIFDKVSKSEQIYFFEPVDETLARRLLQARRELSNAPHLEFLPSPNFYLKDQEVRQYFGERHRHVFNDFYQWQRERFNILIGEDYRPLGGQWVLEGAQAKPLPSGQSLPSFAVFGDNKFVDEAAKYIDKHFPNNPGSSECIWPTNRQEAHEWLTDFIDNRLENYGMYEETLDSKAAWLYHSALASSLNLGLLAPQEVVEAVVVRNHKKAVNVKSLEHFVRNILGWREFIRGEYLASYDELAKLNPLKASRHLTDAWYTGNLGLPPFDNLVQKLLNTGYAHSSECQSIATNLMVLCEIQPSEMRRWFMQLFVDAFDWSVLPQVANANRFDSQAPAKPVINPGSYILQISNYQRGEWVDIWDGLYWRFINKHRSALNQNAQLRPAVQRLERLDADRKRIISYRAEDFLNSFTTL